MEPATVKLRPSLQQTSRLAWLALIVGLAVMAGLIQGSRRSPWMMYHGHAAAPARNRPNLLLIVSDDQSGLWLGASGDTRGATSHLDALARQGVFFARAYCNSPLCTPSRQSFITGKLPHAVGVTRLETRLPDTARTLGAWLGGQGYRTAAIGKMHFNGPSHHGFNTRIDVHEWLHHLKQVPPVGGDLRQPWRPFVDPPTAWLNTECKDEGLPADSTSSAYFVDQAVAFMNQPSDQPFAMVVGFYEPHAPFRFPREWKGRYRPEQFTLSPVSERDRGERPKVFRQLTDDQLRGIQAAYYTSLSFMDHQVGRLLNGLEESGLSENTLVVFVSDNGYLLGQHGRVEKNCFYEPAVRVPWIMRWPGRLPRGRQITDLVELVDLFPTLCDLLDAPAPGDLHGLDLAGLARDLPSARGRTWVFSQYTENEEAMARSDRYKLIVGSGRRAPRDHLETGQLPRGPYLRLFDLQKDPDETVDLADDPRLEPVRDDLMRKLRDRMVSTWEGPERIPPGLSLRETIEWCLVPRDR